MQHKSGSELVGGQVNVQEKLLMQSIRDAENGSKRTRKHKSKVGQINICRTVHTSRPASL